MIKIETIQDLKSKDQMIQDIFTAADFLYKNDLANISEDNLAKMLGRITGIYAYMESLVTEKRAERDIQENYLKQLKDLGVLAILSEGGYKVTEAKAKVNSDLKEESEKMIIAEANKDRQERLAKICSSLISIIQTTLALRRSNKMVSRTAYDN